MPHTHTLTQLNEADLQLAAAEASTSRFRVARQERKEEKKGWEESRHTEVRLWLRELAVLEYDVITN